MTKRDFERKLEWNIGAAPITLSKNKYIAWPESFIVGTERLTIERDDELRLHATLEGTIARADVEARRSAAREVLPGTLHDATSVAFGAHGATYEMTFFLYVDPNELDFTQRDAIKFRQHEPVVRRRRTHKTTFSVGEQGVRFVAVGAPMTLSEWFVNTPSSVDLTRFTHRTRETTYTRARDAQTKVARETPTGSNARDQKRRPGVVARPTASQQLSVAQTNRLSSGPQE